MRNILVLPTALVLLVLVGQSESRSIIQTTPSPFDFGSPQQQQPLNIPSPSPSPLPPPQHVQQHFDARENSVGVLFTTSSSGGASGGEPLHLWLPLGKKVFTRDAPVLPLHPLTARITTLITSTPELAKPEEIERVQCDVWTTTTSSSAERKVSFSRRDGLIHLELGKEVESYECHS